MMDSVLPLEDGDAYYAAQVLREVGWEAVPVLMTFML